VVCVVCVVLSRQLMMYIVTELEECVCIFGVNLKCLAFY